MAASRWRNARRRVECLIPARAFRWMRGLLHQSPWPRGAAPL